VLFSRLPRRKAILQGNRRALHCPRNAKPATFPRTTHRRTRHGPFTPVPFAARPLTNPIVRATSTAAAAVRPGAAETARHARLKRLALAWARGNGFEPATPEVRVPRSGFRADVAAAAHGDPPQTAVFECKQSRADLLKDAHVETAIRGRLAKLTARRQALEEILAVHRPDLRCGEALWPEYDSWDFAALGHKGYSRVLTGLASARRLLRQGTKFSRMARYRCADFLYLVVEDDIFASAEIPPGWGLLIRTPGKHGDHLRLARPPEPLAPTPAQRDALLRQIARARLRQSGVTDRTAGVAFRPGDGGHGGPASNKAGNFLVEGAAPSAPRDRIFA